MDYYIIPDNKFPEQINEEVIANNVPDILVIKTEEGKFIFKSFPKKLKEV